MKYALIITHCLYIIAGAAISSGYNYPWIGLALVATSGIDAYLTQQLPTTPSAKLMLGTTTPLQGFAFLFFVIIVLFAIYKLWQLFL